MSWAAERAQLLGHAPVMSVDEVFSALLERDAVLWIDGDVPRYVGPDQGDSDPLLAAINEHRVILTELFTYAPDGRCTFTDCYRLRAPGDRLVCLDCRVRLDAEPYVPQSQVIL